MSSGQGDAREPMQGQVRAPEINVPGVQWFNVESPISVADLKGKIVILDFWTFCCINCMHILPVLRKIEDKYPQEVAVIGIHTPKFAAEKDSQNVERAISRYGIRHPVVHDPDYRIWQHYAVRAWPTLVFLAPDGSVLGQAPGEPNAEALMSAVDRLVEEARTHGHLKPSDLPLSLPQPMPTHFAFPGKIKRLSGNDGASWALADAGHHQIVLLDDDGKEVLRVGSGDAGREDGDFERASFRAPEGLAAAGRAIFVADTMNHSIRLIDLDEKRVSTLAGTGRRGMPLNGPVPAGEAVLASPWDIAVDGNKVYFANAGTHQLGLLDLAISRVMPLAGNGGENIIDGPAMEAQLAQPSGLTLSADKTKLYFADSETSSIRVVNLADPAHRVTTLVGTGLFDFGHVNGDFSGARLQHPLGLDRMDGNLVVADSYNAAIRVMDLDENTVRDLDEGDFVCEDSLCLPLGEPAGITVRDDKSLLLVDTNNHRVLIYDLEAKTYRTWAG